MQLNEQARRCAALSRGNEIVSAMYSNNEDEIKAKIRLILQHSLSTLEESQRNESRHIVQVVKSAMEDIYADAFAERGSGSHQRRKDIMEGFLRNGHLNNNGDSLI